MTDRLEVILNNPQVDPHGHPIPTKQGQVARLNYQSLADVAPGQTITIKRVSDWDSEQLHYLQELGLVPGTQVTVIDKAPFNGPLTLQLDQKTIAIAQNIAQEIGVAA